MVSEDLITNIISQNGISDNLISGNTISENLLSQNQISENVLSSNVIIAGNTDNGFVSGNIISNNYISEVIVGNLPEEVQEKITSGIIEEFMKTLPQKVIGFGIRVALSLVILFVGLFIIKSIRKILKQALIKAGSEKGVQSFIDSCVNIVMWVGLILLIVANFGFNVASVVTILSAASITAGLALQGSLSNFIGGILILILKPFKVGDYIIESVGKNEGVVTEISFFYTRLKTKDNKIIVIPNGNLANNITTNVTANPERMLELEVGISYDADIDRAKEVAKTAAINLEFVNKDKEIITYVSELGESSVIIGIRAYVPSDNYLAAKWALTEAIKKAYDTHNIEIAYNHMDIRIRK